MHLWSKAGIVLSAILNILLLVGFFWFTGSRLQQQVSQLSDTLPQTIHQVKDNLHQTTLGSKVMKYLNSSGNSKKTIAVVKSLFSSSFGILSDLYIVVLIGFFFTSSPSLYKKGIIH